ncbi:MAG: FAD-dependent monooxygenase [Flavobacteriaceae bacterium]|nr:FAD-dependent monooxygenase [Flavobacteriaceae bacterium]
MSDNKIPASVGNKENILIIGAGLCGSLLALRLGQRGYQVKLVEKRPDLRKVAQDAGRSINLAFSDRGMKAMRMVGLQKEVKKLCLPMLGRMIHDTKGNKFMSLYSGREDKYINSISRPGLNMILLDAAEELPNVTMFFNQSCQSVDLENTTAIFKDYNTKKEITHSAAIIFGTDGAGSVMRNNMFINKSLRLSFSIDWLSHSYKELTIPATENGEFKTDNNALHIWPRGENMLIALPNIDGSFTVTLFLAHETGADNFENLNTPKKVSEYFEREFPDAVALMPNLTEEFFENPTGHLGTVKCYPWNAYGNTLIMGDAAHAIVPFYGQGMIASFEDVVVLDKYIEKHEGDLQNEQTSWKTIFSEYQKERKKDTDAIADLAIDNFYEMKEHTANPIFQEKRKLEIAFEDNFPEKYNSKYSLVTFNADIPYSEAMKKGRAQDKAILNLLDYGKLTEAMSLEEKLTLVLKETKEILHDDDVAKNL